MDSYKNCFFSPPLSLFTFLFPLFFNRFLDGYTFYKRTRLQKDSYTFARSGLLLVAAERYVCLGHFSNRCTETDAHHHDDIPRAQCTPLPTLLRACMRYRLSERYMVVDAVVYTRRPGYLYTTLYWVQLRSSFCFPPALLRSFADTLFADTLPSERPVYVCAQCIADCWLHGTDRRLAVDTDTPASERSASSRLFGC